MAFAGTAEKVKWIKDDFGVKFAFNYKEVHLDSILKKYAVEGVDCYFDNVNANPALLPFGSSIMRVRLSFFLHAWWDFNTFRLAEI